MVQTLPSLLLHADWSIHPKKRWVAWAVRWQDGYLLQGIEPVGEPELLLPRLLAALPEGGTAMVGFDFPLGFPSEYARKVGVTNFIQWLREEWRQPPWEQFEKVCSTAEEIALHRPFYPQRPGGTKQQHLVDGLGVSSMSDLFRRCDRGTHQRQKAASLFWTLGGNQVGKAALSGWREWMVPLLQQDNVRVWPFDGALGTLLEQGGIVLTEAYPGEYVHSLGGLLTKGSKRRQSDRQKAGEWLLQWCESSALYLRDEEEARLLDGFGEKKEGEDPFDALVGLCGLWQVLCGQRESGEPADAPWLETEGWILGLDATTLRPPIE